MTTFDCICRLSRRLSPSSALFVEEGLPATDCSAYTRTGIASPVRSARRRMLRKMRS